MERLARILVTVLLAGAVVIPIGGRLVSYVMPGGEIHGRTAEQGGRTPGHLGAQLGDSLELRLTSDGVIHGFFSSTHGLVRHDAPPTFFFQMPFWPMFGHLSEHIARIGEAFEGTHIHAEVLVVDLASGLPSRDKLEAYGNAFEELLWALMRHHLDFRVVDNDILADGELVPGGVKVVDIEAKW